MGIKSYLCKNVLINKFFYNFNITLTQLEKTMNLIYANKLKYKNEIDLLQKIIRIYSIVMLEDNLENHEEKVLMFYFKYGYSSKTKEKIRESLDINSHYLNTINYHLDKKGYLKKDPNNRQKKHLADGLQQLRDAFLKDGMKVYALKIEKV